MICNKELHDGIIESGEIICPFCDVKLDDCSVTKVSCCQK